MKKFLPELVSLMIEVFRNNKWIYSTTDKRSKEPHLKVFKRARDRGYIQNPKVPRGRVS